MSFWRILPVFLSILPLHFGEFSAEESTATGPLDGWNILQPEYVNNGYLDFVSVEWDYFSVHNRDGKFTGSIGFILIDPRAMLGTELPELPSLTPAGGNSVVAGQFLEDDGVRFSNLKDFGVSSTTASATERSFRASDPADGQFAIMTPIPDTNNGGGGGMLHLQGQSPDIAFDLFVSQDWADRPAWEPVSATDVAVIQGEHWTVNMLWPRTRIEGNITRLSSGEVYDIDAYGYRGNSFGRYAFVLSGWDFAVVSDEATGVLWAWQSYHKGDTLDTVDVSFVEDGILRDIHFDGSAGEIGWIHDSWHYDKVALQCVPDDARVVADNGEYRVEATVQIGENQIPILSDATILTQSFLLQEWFPTISGTITSLKTNKVVKTFDAVGCGDISMLRRFLDLFPNDLSCTLWGWLFVSSLPFP